MSIDKPLLPTAGKRVLIVANGERLPGKKMEELAARADYIIAADGGLNACLNQDIRVDWLVGDLDSRRETEGEIRATIKTIHIAEQNSTDMEKALNFALTLKPIAIEVINALGKRSDHALGNILILHNFEANVPLTVYDAFGRFTCLKPGNNALTAEAGQIISLFVFSETHDVKLHGFRYPLEKKIIRRPFLGVSNEAEADNPTVSFSSGKVICYMMDEHEDDK